MKDELRISGFDFFVISDFTGDPTELAYAGRGSVQRSLLAHNLSIARRPMDELEIVQVFNGLENGITSVCFCRRKRDPLARSLNGAFMAATLIDL